MAENKTIRRFLPIVVACATSVLFVLLGYLDCQSILASNPCKMTYAYKDKSPVKLNVTSPYTLWKISNPKSNKLNPQPVLFIHGHLGRYALSC